MSSHIRYPSTVLRPALWLTVKSTTAPHFIQCSTSSQSSSSELPEWCAVDYRLADTDLLRLRGRLGEVWGGAPDWLSPAPSGQNSRPQTGYHQTPAASSVYPRGPTRNCYCFLHVLWLEKGWGALMSSGSPISTSPTIALNMCSTLEPCCPTTSAHLQSCYCCPFCLECLPSHHHLSKPFLSFNTHRKCQTLHKAPLHSTNLMRSFPPLHWVGAQWEIRCFLRHRLFY